MLSRRTGQDTTRACGAGSLISELERRLREAEPRPTVCLEDMFADMGIMGIVSRPEHRFRRWRGSAVSEDA